MVVPGKIVLGGEHAVSYGKPALTVPTNEPFVVRASWTEGGEDTCWHIVEARGSYRLTHGTTEPGTDVHPFIERALRKGEGLAKALLESEGKQMDVQAVPSGTIRIVSGLPGKSGMGSSAAVAVALTGLVARVILAAHGVNEAKELPEWEAAAGYVEDLVRKGHAGLDVATSMRQHMLWFRDEKPGPRLILPLNGVHSMFEGRFVLFASGAAQETAAEMGEYVRRKLTRGIASRRRLEKNEELVRQLHGALMEGKEKETGEAIQGLSDWLISLGVVGKTARGILDACARNNIPTKVCGTGGRARGSGMILALLPEKGSEKAKQLATDLQCDLFPLALPLQSAVASKIGPEKG